MPIKKAKKEIDKPQEVEPLFEPGSIGDMFLKNKEYFTVSEFLDVTNEILRAQKTFVAGEVTEFRAHDKWISFSLKDKEDNSILRCFLSVWTYRKAGVLLEDGMQIKIGGYTRVYKPAGTFSFNVESIEPLGEGSLKKAYELLLKKFEAEGFFTRKREIPKFIKKVGVISSKSGVVIHDFLKNLKPLGFSIRFFDSRVEGVDAVWQIVDGIKYFNDKEKDVDVLILMRGGGSLESMQAFNNEQVCREIFASKIPVLCGIGHEVDVPIACLVADAYVSTPTAVAFRVNSSWDDIINGVPFLERTIFSKFEFILRERKATLPGLQKEIIMRFSHTLSDVKQSASTSSGAIFSGFRQIFFKFNLLSQKILKDSLVKISGIIVRAEDSILKYEKLFSILDPERNLRLGYSIVFDKKGRVLKDVESINVGDIVNIRLKSGEAESEIKRIIKSK